eukprot:TRINITY_DN4425_c0_g1_i4.p1 TRINITY_DN4425_c0_g1~~TRINITY_DN4425_c0_g1_i4.p1  ORF type:complete len:472 (+),score=133.64 TRINITY_DN4425_c0_g1_i4:84-1418(+)
MASQLPAAVYQRGWYHGELDAVAEEARRASVPAPSAVLEAVVASVYHCSIAEAGAVRADIHADNPDETQRAVPILDTLLVCVAHESRRAVRAMPVAGTNVEDGFVQPCPFYSRRRANGVAYRDILLYVLHGMWKDGDGALTNYVVNIVEAAFNCNTRHKEVFEHMLWAHFEKRLRAGSGNADAPLHRYFAYWLDTYKRDALKACVVQPLLYLFRNEYSVYENLDSHGAAFWGAVFEAASGVPMPFEHMPDIEGGWSWGARHIDVRGDRAHARAVALCVEGLGQGWRVCMAGQPAMPTHPPLRLKALRWGSFEAVLEAVRARRLRGDEAAEIDAALNRFLALLSPARIARRFALHLATRGGALPPEVAALDACAWIDATDPENLVVDEGAVAAALRDAGVSLAPREDAVSHSPRSGAGSPSSSPKRSKLACLFFWWTAPKCEGDD